VITPRVVRLLRVADLQTLHRTLIEILPADPFATRECAVILPSRGSAEELRRTIENLTLLDPAGPRCAVALPDLVTRDDFYVRIAQRLPGSPPLANAFAREVLLGRAVREASAAGTEPPFRVRSGHVAEILRLYDELRRRHRTVADFDRLLSGTLESDAQHDRGASRLLQQTRFLTSAFQRFEAAVAAAGSADEHVIRALALDSEVPLYRQVVVTVADQAADPHGLWSADFDLLARLPHLADVHVVITEASLATGFHERLHDLFPGIEEERRTSVAPPPRLVVPDDRSGGQQPPVFVYRDREEELAAVVSMVGKTTDPAMPLDRTAVVFQRPLPYLYLARQVFQDGRVPYQALDALPLAAEPFAAAIDLIFTCVSADFTRAALIELLRSPHFSFGLQRGEIAALDRYLVDRKYLGRTERLAALAEEAIQAPASRPERALAVAARVAHQLDAAFRCPSAPEQIDAILEFVATHEGRAPADEEWVDRHRRARAAVLSAFEMLRDAHSAHDPDPLSPADLAGAVRRWIEGQTFAPRLGTSGIMLMDAAAAAFADADHVRIVGLVENDWPERPSRSIFYPQSLLSQLGWPSESTQLSAARARFQDLLRLPRHRVSLSTFTLEDDAIVSPTALLDEVHASGLPVEVVSQTPARRVLVHEALMAIRTAPAPLSGLARSWLELRTTREDETDRFKGFTGPRQPTAYAVSHVERYLDCPFRYFAAYVLKLPEEREEEAWMTPQERGQFVHEVFYEFFTEWQKRGHGAVTTANVADAVRLFAEIAEGRLALLAEGDRALERTLLLGSAAASGLAERTFGFEIEHDTPVIERLLEYELKDTFEFSTPEGRKRIAIRAKADRIDLLADGSLRIVDYKLGRAPKSDRALQLPVYGACSAQALEGKHGRSWTPARAGYVAFKEKQAFVPLGRTREELDEALAEGQARLCSAVDGIERGVFPVKPDDPFLCNWCAYPSVCRKDYVGDE
jgi:RecB family exonuclease